MPLRIAVGLMMLGLLLLVNPGAGTLVNLQVREAAESNGSNTDSISSGINSVHYTFGLGVINQGAIEMKNLTIKMAVANIVAVDDEQYAQWNNSFVQWIFPQNVTIKPHMQADPNPTSMNPKQSKYQQKYDFIFNSS